MFLYRWRIYFRDARVNDGMGLPILVVLLAAGLSLAMAGAWAIARRPGRSGWTDAIWSSAIGLAGSAAALVPIGGEAAFAPRRLTVATLVLVWSLRLAGHIARRAARGQDDPRYAELRRRWGGSADVKLFGFLQLQALCGLPLALSAMAAAHAPGAALAWSDALGGLILIGGIVGEGVADGQLRAFAANPANRRRVCDVGLWSRSRHPNYAFEWLAWTAYPVIAIPPDPQWGWGYAALAGPALIYWLLVHVSGIPPLEEHLMRSRGQAFVDYAGRVPAFWPALFATDGSKTR